MPCELRVNDRGCEFDVTIVARAVDGDVTAGPAALSGFEGAKPLIHRAFRDRITVPSIDVRIFYLNYADLSNFFR